MAQVNMSIYFNQLLLFVFLQGNVEIWLGTLLKEMKNTLHCVIRQAFFAIEDTAFKMMDFQVNIEINKTALVIFYNTVYPLHEFRLYSLLKLVF